jgi:hypothetical protein
MPEQPDKYEYRWKLSYRDRKIIEAIERIGYLIPDVDGGEVFDIILNLRIALEDR